MYSNYTIPRQRIEYSENQGVFHFADVHKPFELADDWQMIADEVKYEDAMVFAEAIGHGKPLSFVKEAWKFFRLGLHTGSITK